MVLRLLSGSLGTVEPAFFLAVPCRGNWSSESSSTWWPVQSQLVKSLCTVQGFVGARCSGDEPTEGQAAGIAGVCLSLHNFFRLARRPHF